MSDNDNYRIAAGELRQFIEQIEQREAEKRDISDSIKEVYAEAKARGYQTKPMREIVKLRKKDRDQAAEEEAVFDLYREALGL